MPDNSVRQAYIALWNNRLKTEMRLSPLAISQIAAHTDGFSFAYLKELFLSSMIRWIGAMTTTGIEEIMISQIAILQEQINSMTANSEGTKELETDKE